MTEIAEGAVRIMRDDPSCDGTVAEARPVESAPSWDRVPVRDIDPPGLGSGSRGGPS